MEEWITALKAANNKEYYESGDQHEFLTGHHQWYATSHARPTYCNICKDPLSGVTSHGLSCEICKYKVHKRCVIKVLANCKWTTLASIGHDIIEDEHGNILMPHQWLEGNLPVSSKCTVCYKTCGSVLRLQDWRCLWCRTTVHNACKPLHPVQCPLGLAKVSVVPPTALHSIGNDEAWEVVRPQGSSPLLVFVNSKSGESQGVKFLRRFKQILNPAQVFDLISGGPGLGLRLFRHFDPFRILICSGDGSVGWVLSEIDRLSMHKQCQVGVLPLGTGNDLARVLGWGSSCEDDTHLPQLLDKYEKSSTKMLDRWSVMSLERNFGFPQPAGKISYDDSIITSSMAEYEDHVASNLTQILQSDQYSVIISSAKVLCETVKEFSLKLSQVSLMHGDDQFSEKCCTLNHKLDLLVGILEIENKQDGCDDENEEVKNVTDKQEKDLINLREKIEGQVKSEEEFVRKDALMSRANSLKKAVRQLVEYTEHVVDQQNGSSYLLPNNEPLYSSRRRSSTKPMDTLKVLSTIDSASSAEGSPCPSPRMSLIPTPMPSRNPSSHDIRLAAISPLPDLRRDSACDEMPTLPVPVEFADRRASFETQLTVTVEDCSSNEHSRDQESLWETVVSSLNEDTRSVVAESNMCSRKNSDVGVKEEVITEHKEVSANIINEKLEEVFKQHRESVISLNQDQLIVNAFNNRIEEMDISHIDSSESPSEETTPPNLSISPPHHLRSPIHKSYTDTNFLGVPPPSPTLLTRTNTDIFSGNNNDMIYFKQKTGNEENKAINTSNSELEKQNKENTNNLINKIEKVKNEEDENDEVWKSRFGGSLAARHPFLARNDSRKLYQDNDIDITDDIDMEPELRCSFARFEEGEDIARMSFKRSRRKKKNPPADPFETGLGVKIQFHGSNGDLTKEWNEKFENDEEKENRRTSLTLSETDDEDLVPYNTKPHDKPCTKAPEFQMIVEPPSPTHGDERRNSNDSVGKMSLASSYTAGLLHASPHATRRVSNCSLLKPEIINSFRSKSIEKSEVAKKLPIINPLVRLPSWPNVPGGSGLISKVLLANADALCATAAPLMDFDETLLEGFNERSVMNNYFGIGIDAKISLDFHHRREEHPEKCRSRAKNYMWYGVLGSKEWLQKTYKNLDQRVQLECDGQRIPLPSLQGIVILNIPSFMGGTNFWGGTKEDEYFLAPSFDDKILEVVAVFGSVQMAASRLINLQHHRIAQCQTVQINILGDEGVPVQVDGEAWIQPPGVMRIIHKNRTQMLCRNRALETSLKAWEEKQKISHSQSQQTQSSQTQSSCSVPEAGFPPLFTEEECRLLLGFIEVTTTLVKCIKLVTISHPGLNAGLYELADKTSTYLENIHPRGKIIEGLELRPLFTELATSVKELCEEACTVMRDKAHSIKLREDLEGKLSAALADAEIELRKCSMDDHGMMGLHHIFEQAGGHKGRGRGLSWLKLRRHSHQRQREVGSWGVVEVSQWLEALQLPEYVDSFAKNDIRGKELLALARRDLKDLGVTKVGHVKRILQAIRDLNM